LGFQPARGGRNAYGLIVMLAGNAAVLLAGVRGGRGAAAGGD